MSTTDEEADTQPIARGARAAPRVLEGGEEANDLQRVLRDIIGITGDGQISRFQTHGGITTAEDIAYVDIDSSAMVKMRLRALKSWIDTSLDNYDSVDVTDFDGETCKNLQCKLARKTRGDSSSTGSSMEGKSSDGTGMKLSVFDGKPENWEDSKRNLIAKLNQMKNSEGVPLYYVIRSDQAWDQSDCN